MPRPLVLTALIVIVPSLAFADDARPDVDIEVHAPGVQIDVHTPPPGPAPVVAPAAPPVVATESDPCHGGWRSHRARGRFGLGFSKGHLELADETEGSQRALIGRIAMHRGWELELELARTTLADDTQKTGGGALVKSFGQRKLRPYLVAGAGGGRVERADGREDRLRYGELGGGVLLRGRRLAIGFDLRRGVRSVDDAVETTMPIDTMAAPREVTSASDDDHERYTRGRILALVYF